MEEQVHGTCVEIDRLGVLLMGPPGSGKSDLALRLIDGGAALVADDRVNLTAAGDVLSASAPAEIAGLLEVRGVGIMPLPGRKLAALALVVHLVGESGVERLPQPAFWECQGVRLPALSLDPFAASAAAKVRLAVRGVKDGIIAARTNQGSKQDAEET